jgi:CDP-glucose 4,6-dehydratase
VLVTGADGFVGGWLVRALAASGAEVHALVWAGQSSDETRSWHVRQTSAKVVPGNITDLAFLSALMADAHIDTVYHLAAINTNTGAGLSPHALFETNIRGVYTVLEACRTSPTTAHAIVASSREVEDCFRPESARKLHPYMTSKAAAELVTRAYGDTFGVPVVLVRSDNLYGGGDFNWSRLVPNTIRAVLHGETPVIRSSGLLKRDYVHIEDAVAAYLAIGERLDDPAVAGRLFRLATGTATSVLDMVKQILRVAGLPDLEPRVLNEEREERVDPVYTPELERTVLGWQSRYPLAEGLVSAVQWYRDFFRQEKTER